MACSHMVALVLVAACATPRNPAMPQEAEGPEEPEERTFDSAGPEVLDDNTDTVLEVPETERLCRLDLLCEEPPAFDDPAACTLRVTRHGGDVDWDGPAEVRIRGRSSSQVAKPGYAVELPEPANLLDMGGERDWVIDGLYYDRLLVRDKLGYDMLRDMGQYAPESALCELYMGDVYYGVHALVERVERDDDRIDIADGTETGRAFVLTQNDTECLYTNTTTYGCWKLVSPGTLSPTGADALTAHLAAWEASIVAAEPVAGWIDVDSAVDAVLVEEFFKNEDAFYTSMHLWKDDGGLLHFVPWDLDMTFGQFPYYPYGDYGNVHIWIDYRPQLWATIGADPVFHARLVERWVELRSGLLATDAVLARIDRLQAILGPAIARNDEVWPIEAINYGGWFYEVSSYADEDAHVRAWLTERLIWMDATIADW